MWSVFLSPLITKPQNATAMHVDEDDSLKWGLIDSKGIQQQGKTVCVQEVLQCYSCYSSKYDSRKVKNQFYIYIYYIYNIYKYRGIFQGLNRQKTNCNNCNAVTHVVLVDSLWESASLAPRKKPTLSKRVRQFLILTLQPRFLNRFSQATPLRFWQSQFFFVPLQMLSEGCD